MSGVNVVQCNRLSPKPNALQKSEKSDNESRDIVLLNKHSTLSQQIKQITKPDIVTDTVRKKPKCNNKELIPIRTPPPPAVARRNARERNRVKQVNNGFANLRQHIPHSIAAAYESGRSGNKKLSKVETLRMAVEYIRSLEDLLSLSDSSSSGNVSNPSSLSYKASAPLSSLEIQPGTNYAASLTSPSSDDDNISSNSTPPPLQYVKIDGHDTYHIVPIPMHIFQNNEHLKSLKVESDLLSNSAFIDPEVEFKKVQLSTDTNTNTSLSPEIYSDSSLSPGAESGIQAFIPVFNIEELSSPSPSIKLKEASKSPNEEMRILCRNLIMLQADAETDPNKQPLNMNELISW